MELDNLQTFFALFSTWRFHIPDYQRGYAWGKDEWQALMDDIVTLTEDNDHFTGLLVLHETRDPNLSQKTLGIIKPVFDVVDGQQRLTTIVVLLNEIQKEMDRLDGVDFHETAESIRDTFLFEHGTGSILVPKMILDINNHAFFMRNILGIGSTDLLGARIQSHRNLDSARLYFQGELQKRREDLKDAYPAWLEHFYSKIVNQLKVMVYRLRSEADAGVVFESMNNRGKKPNNLDLVKNYLLFLASKLTPDLSLKLTEDINQAWTTIFEQLASITRPFSEDDLLAAHWFAFCDYAPKPWQKAKEKANLIKGRFKLVSFIDHYETLFEELELYVQSLQNASVVLADALHPERSGAFQTFSQDAHIQQEIVKYSQKLLRLDIFNPYSPLLIALRLRFPNDSDKYLETIQLIERYTFRVRRIADKKITEDFFYRLANQFLAGKISYETLVDSIKRDLLAKCSDDLFIKRFSLEDPKPWYGQSSYLVKYFLYEYEEHLFDEKLPVINWTALEKTERSIEHILPQTPAEGSPWTTSFTADERLKYTHALGNLTLTEDNSKLGRKSFSEKKGGLGQSSACYLNSNLRIERELAGVSGEWTPQQIEIRQKRFADWALTRWHVQAPPPLPNEPLERLRALAKDRGWIAEFDMIHALATTSMNLAASAKKNAMTYKPKPDWRLTAITVYVYTEGMTIIVKPKNFPKYERVTPEQFASLFPKQETIWVTREQWSGFWERLQKLADLVSSRST